MASPVRVPPAANDNQAPLRTRLLRAVFLIALAAMAAAVAVMRG